MIDLFLKAMEHTGVHFAENTQLGEIGEAVEGIHVVEQLLDHKDTCCG